MKQILVCVTFVALLSGVLAQTTPRSQAKLSSVPGYKGTLNYDNYAGYIAINEITNKSMYYWFVTSQNDPANDPVILWLQGGPGCSDFGAGFLQENGPFLPYIIDANTQTVGLVDNFYSWNRQANMIFVDSPVGVGFSYSDDPTDYFTNDNMTALDTSIFLSKFFDMYNEFSTNPFWITGESYGGMYVPTLAYEIVTNSSYLQIASNLKRGGLMLGNPVTGCEGAAFGGEDDILFMNTQVNLYYWHAMISRRKYDEWNRYGCNTAKPSSVSVCSVIYAEINAQKGFLHQPLMQRTELESLTRSTSLADVEKASINPDCLYYSFCTGNATLKFTVVRDPDCFNIDKQIAAYLNDPAVQAGINAKPTKWQACGGVEYKRVVGSLMPYLEDLFKMAPTMRVLYYAGDIDIATVPFAGTQRCLETLNRPIVSEWRPWIINNEIAGYVEVYDKYTFATVKAAGHEALAYQPASTYALFTAFLNNAELPK